MRVKFSTPLAAILIFFVTLNAFCLFKTALHLRDSTTLEYYSELGWSFLHGRTDLPEETSHSVDLSPYQGRVYSYYPPLSAFLMMPLLLARGGPLEFPQRLFGIVFASLNSMLFFLLFVRLSRLLHRTNPWTPIIAAAVFTFGTSNLIFGVVANHWFIGQLTASTFALLALWAALDRRSSWRAPMALLSGIAFGLAAGGRQQLALSLPLWIYLATSDDAFSVKLDQPMSFYIQRIAAVTLPVILVTLGLFLYNHARFGRWNEYGMAYQNMDLWQRLDYVRWGAFNIRYVLRDCYFILLRPPCMQGIDHQSATMGFSILAQCPFLVLLFRRRPLIGSLWKGLGIAAALVALPIFFFVSPGHNQFGARYIFDILPFLGALVYATLSDRTDRLFVLLGILSIAINIAGVYLYLAPTRL